MAKNEREFELTFLVIAEDSEQAHQRVLDRLNAGGIADEIADSGEAGTIAEAFPSDHDYKTDPDNV
jgi:hypothetical protein